MPFRIVPPLWLQEETARVKAFLLMPRLWRRAWSLPALKDALSQIGLDYSMPELQEINEELHLQGVVEDLP